MKLSVKITASAVMIFIMAVSAVSIFGADNAGNTPEINKKSLLDGSFGDELMNFAADNIAGRELWRSLGAEINARVGEPVVNGVYITDERMLSVSSSTAINMETSAAAVNRFAEKYKGAVYFAAVPTSTGIYSDALPSYMLAVTEKQQADRLYEELSADIRKIDAYTILKMLSDNYIYYRSDTKWTSYGAYCVYRTVIQKLGFMPVSYDKYTIRHVTDSYRGNLYDSTLYMESKADILDIYEYDDGTEITECVGYDGDGIDYGISLYDTDAVDTDDQYNLYLGEAMPLIKISTSVNNNKKLLVIGDEYADCFIPFLTKHYSEIAFISAEHIKGGIEKYIDPDEYGQTLFLLGIDSIGRNVLEDAFK